MSDVATGHPARMLLTLARPYRWKLLVLLMASLVVVALQLVGPRLVALGIDVAIGPTSSGDYGPLVSIALALLVAGALTWILTVVSRRGIWSPCCYSTRSSPAS